MDEKYTFIKERVLELAKAKGITIEIFLESIGMTYGSFKGKAKKGTLNSTAIEEIYTNYPDVSLEWLITGKGEMLKSDYPKSDFVTNSLEVSEHKREYQSSTDYWKDQYIELQRKYTALLEGKLEKLMKSK